MMMVLRQKRQESDVDIVRRLLFDRSSEDTQCKYPVQRHHAEDESADDDDFDQDDFDDVDKEEEEMEGEKKEQSENGENLLMAIASYPSPSLPGSIQFRSC